MLQKIILIFVVSSFCLSCSSLKKDAVSIQLYGNIEVDTKSDTLWIPIRIENKSDEIICVDTFFGSLPSSHTFTIKSNKSESLYVTDGIYSNNHSGGTVELKPHIPIYCKLPYVIERARCGNYHCRLQVFAHPEWGVDFEVRIPYGYAIDDKDEQKRKSVSPKCRMPIYNNISNQSKDYKSFIKIR